MIFQLFATPRHATLDGQSVLVLGLCLVDDGEWFALTVRDGLFDEVEAILLVWAS